MNVKKASLVLKEPAVEQPVNNGTTRPKNPLANGLTTKPKPLSDDVSATRPKNPPSNVRPTEGYILEVDGKFKTEFESSEAAMKAAWSSRRNIRKSRSKYTTQRNELGRWSNYLSSLPTKRAS